jgi:hypothetical protein
MPVQEVIDGQILEANAVIVMPPVKYLTLQTRRLRRHRCLPTPLTKTARIDHGDPPGQDDAACGIQP